MITVRRATERRHDRNRQQEVWRSFYPEASAGPSTEGFGILERLDEERLPPGASAPRTDGRDAEILTYVREGALAHEDSLGGSGVIQAGEFHCRTTGRGLRHSEKNASRTEWVHVFQLWMRPAEAERRPGHEQKRFSAAERRGSLCVVASPDGRRGSLRIHQDALVFSALLDPGQHLIHELAPGRDAWLHLVMGEVTLGDLVLSAGDGAGVSGERAVSLTAREEAEILLLDLGRQRSTSGAGGGRS